MTVSVTRTAPGKAILFGEHAVVYGQPAIAVPVHKVQASVVVEPAPAGNGLTLVAVNLGQTWPLASAAEDDPLATMVRLVLAHLKAAPPDAILTIDSSIPIASGLGSGTAVSTAIVRGLSAYLCQPLSPATVSGLVFEVERLHHGTPSGIDNTVIAYGAPVFFIKGQAIETFGVAAPLRLLIGDSGQASSTKIAVGEVRSRWQEKPAHYERLFEKIGAVTREARTIIEKAEDAMGLGELMNENHQLLRDLGVSSDELERLVFAARDAGAPGAKLSGAGRGGSMIALTAPGKEAGIAAALRRAGAVQVIETEVPASITDREP